MQRFVRGNEIICTGTFTALSGSTTQPTNAEAKLVYTGMNDLEAVSYVTLTKDSEDVWTGAWDSNQCSGGIVYFKISCSGGLQAATQGQFEVLANHANN